MSDETRPGATELSERPHGDATTFGEGCKLVQLSGPHKGDGIELLKARTLVGSASDADVCVRDGTVSRRHFQILRDGTAFVIKDLGSTNGTLLDGTRIREAVLRPGALIKAGDVEMRLEPVVAPRQVAPSDATSFGRIHGQSYAMRMIFAVLERVANSEATILIEGETGTGKSALARAIHQNSARAGGPFIVVDCGAIAPSLVESELFGHEKGAFTGAIKDRRGAFEMAHGGTLFIDELTELAPNLQPKLLRALEDREINRVGSHAAIPVDCRVIAATQKDLRGEVDAGDFRADLYFRLAVVTVFLPALRERREDLPMLIEHFLEQLPGEHATRFRDLPTELQRQLLSEQWRGNIRELRNSVQRIVLMYDDVLPRAETSAGGEEPPPAAIASDGTVTHFGTDLSLPFKEAKDRLLAEFEQTYVRRLLEQAGGNVTQAAKEAGLDRKSIYNLLTKHGLDGSE